MKQNKRSKRFNKVLPRLEVPYIASLTNIDVFDRYPQFSARHCLQHSFLELVTHLYLESILIRCPFSSHVSLRSQSKDLDPIELNDRSPDAPRPIAINDPAFTTNVPNVANPTSVAASETKQAVAKLYFLI